MDRNHIRQLRRDYLRKHHARTYRELKDDGVLEAHIRHVEGRALALYEKLLAEGVSSKSAEEKALQEVITVQPSSAN